MRSKKKRLSPDEQKQLEVLCEQMEKQVSHMFRKAYWEPRYKKKQFTPNRLFFAFDEIKVVPLKGVMCP